jgi:hypothetical protein
MDGLNTGDIILFHTEDHWYNRLIEKVTRSPLCHSAIILRDPWCTESPLKGLYVVQSTYDGRKDVEDNQVKIGVQVTKLVDVIKDYDWVEIRSISGVTWTKENKDKLTNIHSQIHDIPYDFGPKHWLLAAFNHLNIISSTVERHSDSMWCSAMCAFIYTKMGWLPEETNWSALAPSDLATIEVNEPFKLSKPWILKVEDIDIGNPEERESLLFKICESSDEEINDSVNFGNQISTNTDELFETLTVDSDSSNLHKRKYSNDSTSLSSLAPKKKLFKKKKSNCNKKHKKQEIEEDLNYYLNPILSSNKYTKDKGKGPIDPDNINIKKARIGNILSESDAEYESLNNDEEPLKKSKSYDGFDSLNNQVIVPSSNDDLYLLKLKGKNPTPIKNIIIDS